MKTVEGFYVGESAEDNWKMLDNADSNHYFFHLSSFPSPYVIYPKDSITEKEIKKGAEVCLSHTKFRYLKNIYVDFTQVGNVKKGEIVGEILYRSNRKVRMVKI